MKNKKSCTMNINHINSEYPFKEGIPVYSIINHINDFDSVKSTLVVKNGLSDDIAPVISIVIPVYNPPIAFEDALKSAISQDFSLPYEIVVIDNNSDSTDVKKRVELMSSPLLRYYHNEENIGMVGNWNRCIQLAKAEYVVYLHADDELMPSALSTLWKVHEHVDKKACIIGRSIELGLDGKELYKYVKKDRLFVKTKNYYRISKIGCLHNDLDTGCGALFCKATMIEIGGWSSDFYPAHDHHLLLKYAERVGLYRVNEVVKRVNSAYSVSQFLYKKFPLYNLILSDATAEKYFTCSSILKKLNYNTYLVWLSRKERWDDSDNHLLDVPKWRKIIDKFYRQLYFKIVDKYIEF